MAFTDLVAMPDGTLYGSVYDDSFPIYEINPLNGETTQTNITNPGGYKISGLTTIPYSKSNVRFIGLGRDDNSNVYRIVLIETMGKVIKEITSFAKLSNFLYFSFSFSFSYLFFFLCF